MSVAQSFRSPRTATLHGGFGVDNFPGWSSIHAGVFQFKPTQGEPFHAEFSAWATDRCALSRSASSSSVMARAMETDAENRLDIYVVRLILEGGASGLAGADAANASMSDVVVLDLSRSMEFRLSGSGERGLTKDLTLWLPRKAWLAVVDDDRAAHGVTLKGNSAGGALVGSALCALFEHVAQLSVGELDALACAVGDLCARAVRQQLIASSEAGVGAQLDSFVSIRRYVDRHLSSADLEPSKIARSFGVSRATLSRLFAPVGGVATYIRAKRLQRAYEQIAAPGTANLRIGAIAYSAGFRDLSAFGRAFRETFGKSPAEARKQARGQIVRTLPESPSGVLLAMLKAFGR